MTFKEFTDFVEQVSLVHHKAMVKKGFWDNADINEKKMLIISELVEGLEAIRASPQKFAQRESFEERLHVLNSSINFEYVPTECQVIQTNKHLATCFEFYIKDSYEDELAGTVLRLIDYREGYKESCNQTLADITAPRRFIDLSVAVTLETLRGNPSMALGLIFDFCDYFDIDIKYYVTQAMLYNSTRAFKHGKNF